MQKQTSFSSEDFFILNSWLEQRHEFIHFHAPKGFDQYMDNILPLLLKSKNIKYQKSAFSDRKINPQLINQLDRSFQQQNMSLKFKQYLGTIIVLTPFILCLFGEIYGAFICSIILSFCAHNYFRNSYDLILKDLIFNILNFSESKTI